MADFKNESTYRGYLESGREAEFDKSFDDAVAAVRANVLGKEFPLYINGQAVMTTAKLSEYSPIDGTFIGKFQKATRDETDKAIDAASKAFESWSQVNYKERAAVFQKAADIFSKNKFELAAILSIENGKTRYESVGEVDEAIDFMRYYAGDMLKNKGYVRKATITASTAKVDVGFQGAPESEERITIMMRPYGIWGVIGPFNFPVSISTGMSVGAMITGNTVVFKPSSTDNMAMLTGLRICEMFIEAGLPGGVFNYVSGPGSEVGDELTLSKKVSGIAFTGSRRTGMSMVIKSFEEGVQKIFVAEMGSKNPVIVSRSADLEKAVTGIVSAAFGYGGQKCSAASRVYVHELVKEQFISKLLEKVRMLKTGDPLNKENYIGPLISGSALERYKDAVKEANSSGRVIYGGNVVDNGLKGIYVEPVVADLEHTNRLFHEELFLPFLVVDAYKTFDEALTKANDSEYGLTAGLYSSNAGEIKQFLNKIESGVVYVNRDISATTGAMVGLHTFVGWKGSGLTGKGSGSRFYLQQFMHEQSQSVVKR